MGATIRGKTSMTPVIPKFYWDVDTQEQRIKLMCYLIQQLIEGLDEKDEQVNENTQAITELKNLFEKFQTSGFEDYYEELLAKWIQDNSAYIYSTLAKQVYFGLTDDGYFCAYVPDSWSDITFDTGMVFGRSDYGRLILRFDAAGSGVIDNTYNYTINTGDKETLANIQADLELVGKTLWTNMDELLEGGN